MEEELTPGSNQTELTTERNEGDGEEGEDYSSEEEEDSGEESTSDEEEEEEENSGGDEEEEGELEEDVDENDEDDDDDEDEEEEEDGEEEDEEVLSQPPTEAAEAEDTSSGDENCERCPICLNRLRQQDVGMPESCDHLFCLECIQEWSKNVNTCPVDRQVFRLILAKHPGEDKVYTKFPVENRQELEMEEEEAPQDDTSCEVCGLSDREDRLLLCDSCDAGYHCDCLDPPLARVPVHEWFCPVCVQQRNREEEPLQHGRQIARTRVSERVRRIIADARAARTERRRIVAQRIADRESFMDEEPGPSSSLTPRRRGTKRKRKTGRRSTKKRKTTAKKKTTTKKKTTKKGKPGKKTKRKKKTKKKGKSPKKSNVSSAASPALARTAQGSATVKGRIADKLGLKPPPRGSSIPIQKAPVSGGGRGATRYEAAPSFSILGTRDELYSFAEDEGEERVPVNRPAIPASTLSRSALSSHRPLGLGRLAHSRRPIILPPVETTRSQATGAVVTSSSAAATKSDPTPTAPPAAAAPFDLLGSIMSNQDLLHKGSKHITIQRDGSLTAASSSLAIHAASRKIKLTNSPSRSTSVSEASAASSVSNAEDSTPAQGYNTVAPAPSAASVGGVVVTTSADPAVPSPSPRLGNPPLTTAAVDSVSAGHGRRSGPCDSGHVSLTSLSHSSDSYSHSSALHKVKATGVTTCGKVDNDFSKTDSLGERQKDPSRLSNSGDHEQAQVGRTLSSTPSQQNKTGDRLSPSADVLEKVSSAALRTAEDSSSQGVNCNQGDVHEAGPGSHSGQSPHHTNDLDPGGSNQREGGKHHHKASNRHLGDNSHRGSEDVGDHDHGHHHDHRRHSKEKRRAVKKGFRQLVEDAVRTALKSAWNAKKVTKDEYKDIFKRAVDKVCGSKETVVQQDKIQFLVEAYVAKARKTRTS